MQIAAIVLAAGVASRMGCNKLIEDIGGMPMVRRVVEAVLASRARPVIVVLGNENASLIRALGGLDIQTVQNTDWREGVGASIRAGVAAVPQHCSGALIVLADMPGLSARLIDALMKSFESAGPEAICVATHEGRRGHPVLFARRYFAELAKCAGDVGARQILKYDTAAVVEIEAGDDAPLVDIDTQAALAEYRSRLA